MFFIYKFQKIETVFILYQFSISKAKQSKQSEQSEQSKQSKQSKQSEQSIIKNQ